MRSARKISSRGWCYPKSCVFIPLFLLIAIQLPTGQATPSHAIPSWVFFDCTVHKLPGVYADRVRGCHVFNFCTASGMAFQMVCPNNTLFDQRIKDCVDPNITPVYCPTIWDVPEPTHPPTYDTDTVDPLLSGASLGESANIVPFRGAPGIAPEHRVLDPESVIRSDINDAITNTTSVSASTQNSDNITTTASSPAATQRTKRLLAGKWQTPTAQTEEPRSSVAVNGVS